MPALPRQLPLLAAVDDYQKNSDPRGRARFPIPTHRQPPGTPRASPLIVLSSYTMRETRQNVLRQQVLLVCACLSIVQRARRPEIADDTQQCHPLPYTSSIPEGMIRSVMRISD